ncbi:VOC family protein [Chelatococcus sp. GCM10030263]|uniref:VOC family protein n=1 Tax=Chelatococcus sp. GCM10030263 TaxID=3273387 RepID=UPI00361522C9
MEPAPPIYGVLETALYVDDMERAASFYSELLGLKEITQDARFHAYEAGLRSVLLLFKRGATLDTVHLPGGTIPPHDGHGPLHIAFAVAADQLSAWERRLGDAGIPVEGRTDWPHGGQSIYVRDPDGHLVEFATPGLWPNYR